MNDHLETSTVERSETRGQDPRVAGVEPKTSPQPYGGRGNQSISPSAVPPGWVGRLLAHGAAAWNVRPPTLLAIVFIPVLVVAVGVGTGLVGKAAYLWFTDEDRVAETLQVGLYSLALLMSLWVARLRLHRRERVIFGLYLILAAGLLFMVGEETSWGQRMLGWQTPQELAEINKQKETNFHNIYGVGDTFKWLQMVVGAYGTLLPLLILWRPPPAPLRKLASATIPHYTLIPFFAPMFLWRIFRNVYGEIPQYSFALAHFNEVIELILSIGFFLFLAFQLRTLQGAGAFSPQLPGEAAAVASDGAG